MEVRRGNHPLARALCSLLRMPRSGTGQHVAVRIERSVRGRVVDERWVRTFGRREVTSHLVRADGRITERFGCLELRMRLTHTGDQVRLTPTGAAVRIGGCRLALSPALAPAATARARAVTDGCFEIAVTVSVPWIGPILAYRGRLRPADDLGTGAKAR